MKMAIVLISCGIVAYLGVSAVVPDPFGGIMGGLIGLGFGLWGLIFGILALFSSGGSGSYESTTTDSGEGGSWLEIAQVFAETYDEFSQDDPAPEPEPETPSATHLCPHCNAPWNVRNGMNVTRFSSTKLQCVQCGQTQHFGDDEFPMDW